MTPLLARRARTLSALVLLSGTVCTQSQRLAPLTITGVVLDTNGRPLEGALVRVRADFVYGRAETHTGPDGRYVISDLIRATYRAEAYVQREYAGGMVCQRLAMPRATEYNSFPVSQGAVKNFRWQLTGRVGFTDSYFGAGIGIWLSDLPRESSRGVEFTLTPTGPLLDGSKGEIIVKEAVFKYPASDDGVNDLPLGTYRMRATLIGKDGRRIPLRISPLGTETFSDEVDVVWTPQRPACFGDASGVDRLMVRLDLAR